MKRWKIYFTDYDKPLRIYHKDKDELAKKFNNVLKVEEDNNYSHFEYCNKIVNLSSEVLKDYKGRTVYKIMKSFGYILVRLYVDKEDNIWYDYCEYQINDNKSYIRPCTFTMSTPKEFCDEFLFDNLEYSLISFRKYGEPKLTKPSILKGIKGFSVDFIPKKCACQCFIKDNDLYIKHRDYFSPIDSNPEDIGTPLSYRLQKYGIEKKERFIYPDSWGAIVLRQEAWIHIKNIIPLIKLFDYTQISRMIVEEMEKYHKFSKNSIDLEWERFYEEVCKGIKNTIDNKEEL